MDLEIGKIYEGKVTGITKFGAFILLPGGKSGMVHISEVANTYVDDISKHLSEGQTVNVKLIGVDQQGRINLSIKKALPSEQKERASSAPLQTAEPQKSEDDSFESKLKAFMQSSESRMSDIKSHNDKRSGSRRRK
ncbi:MAG: S1 RNA-binding domain-containing protein [Clostridia bacterium]|nr:S1 RNA-binding domain-containing protein [Clostridia bacterium]